MSKGQRRVAIVTSGFVLASIAGAVIWLLKVVCYYEESPTVRRIAVLTDRDTEFDFEPVHFAPYQFLIGVKGASTDCPPFEGVITVSGPDGKEMTIPIDSGGSQKSNWLDESSETGYILTWRKDPSLSEILTYGHSYRIRIRLEGPLPNGSSLWFSSMRHIPISIFGKEQGEAPKP
jgi:hypothetical protein